jgi:hypothetical protein
MFLYDGKSLSFCFACRFVRCLSAIQKVKKMLFCDSENYPLCLSIRLSIICLLAIHSPYSPPAAFAVRKKCKAPALHFFSSRSPRSGREPEGL